MTPDVVSLLPRALSPLGSCCCLILVLFEWSSVLSWLVWFCGPEALSDKSHCLPLHFHGPPSSPLPACSLMWTLASASLAWTFWRCQLSTASSRWVTPIHPHSLRKQEADHWSCRCQRLRLDASAWHICASAKGAITARACVTVRRHTVAKGRRPL